MRRPAVRDRSPLIIPALVLLAILIALYIPMRARIGRQDRSARGPAPGETLSVFFTSELGGYREPCG